ncbi:MAG TPA: hypothetical protein VLM44_05765 [Lutibacter sp.]|nr:hypothetical protein [Lutibacter sp.]
MKTKIDERKNIIISLKPSYGDRNKGIEKRIQSLKAASFFNIILSMLCGGLVIFSIISELIGNDLFKWQKMALLAILSLSVFLNLPNSYFELKLLKHFKKINDKIDVEGIGQLNIDLKNIIYKLNNGIKNNWIIIVLSILILFMGIWQMLNDNNNPYWKYMKIPILLFYGIILTRFMITNKKLQYNIDEKEKIL